MTVLTLPGLIDPHVHLRDPGQTHKEDFTTGTSAALAGGFTTILDMPNNKEPITTAALLKEKINIAKQKIVCDVGFFFGSIGDNLSEFDKVKNKTRGLKLYLNQTTGNFILPKDRLEKVFNAWKGLILVHAEEKMVEEVLKVVRKTKKQTHFCHISLADELKIIKKAKEEDLPVTCGVTPHHLFLTEGDLKKLGPFGKVKAPLRTKKDIDFIWKNLKFIDLVESDHAPHTINEKRGVTRLEGLPTARTRAADEGALAGGKGGAGPRAVPFGVPGLETTLPLLLTAVSEKRLTINDVIRLCHENPAKIFNLPAQTDTFVEIDPTNHYTLDARRLFTKCGWSPFEGFPVKGKVVRVFIRGTKVFEDGKILVKPGFGKIV